MTLNTLSNNYKSGGNSATPEDVKKNFKKHFSQA
jgi:hypothetical protein